METLKLVTFVQEVVDTGKVQFMQEGLIMKFHSDDQALLAQTRENLMSGFRTDGKKYYYISEIGEMVDGSYRFLAARNPNIHKTG
jgi:hypothetical protein